MGYSRLNNWLIDVIAPDPRGVASAIANFRQVLKEGSLRLHPLITRLIDRRRWKNWARTVMVVAPAPESVPNAATSEMVN